MSKKVFINHGHYPSWMTKEEYNKLNKEYTEIWSRFEKETKDWIKKAGGEKRVNIEVSDIDIMKGHLMIVFSDSINNFSEN